MVDDLSVVPDAPGTYMLLLDLPDRCELEIGRKLALELSPGLYCYVGSALGPGGLAARLGRHAVAGGRRHWHVDHLLPHVRVAGALLIESRRRLECVWASWVARRASACVAGFGASDCRCSGHHFHLGASTRDGRFVEAAQEQLRARHVSGEQLARKGR